MELPRSIISFLAWSLFFSTTRQGNVFLVPCCALCVWVAWIHMDLLALGYVFIYLCSWAWCAQCACLLRFAKLRKNTPLGCWSMYLLCLSVLTSFWRNLALWLNRFVQDFLQERGGCGWASGSARARRNHFARPGVGWEVSRACKRNVSFCNPWSVSRKALAAGLMQAWSGLRPQWAQPRGSAQARLGPRTAAHRAQARQGSI